MLKLKVRLSQWLAGLTRKLKNNFYIYLAVIFSLLVLVDANLFHVGQNMRDKAFDAMVKYRVIKPHADADIVIVDINEASLSTLAKDYGRWPWPRQVLGEFVENIQKQHPQAIVFDIVFSDADIYNPDSDAYFNDVITACDNCFFPILRLDASQDKLSQLQYRNIPGLAHDAEYQADATLAAIMPYFKGALKTQRLGTHNVYPDNDGIVRQYRMIHRNEGWQLPSLPITIAQHAQHPTDSIPDDMLLNWRGKPFSYKYVSFSDVFLDASKEHPTRTQDEFKNKIIIIGSTAPALFDIKATAMDKQFPGVEILATAIDNVKHQDYLKVWRGKTPYVLLSLLLIWLTAYGFYIKIDRDKFNSIFTGSQIGLLVLSYLAINLSNTYLDLTAPIFWAVAFFGIAKTYAMANELALQRWLAVGDIQQKGHLRVLMMPILVDSPEPLSEAVRKTLKREFAALSQNPVNVEVIQGTQSGIWGLLGDMVLLNWRHDDDATKRASIQADANAIIAAIPTVVKNIGLPNETVTRYSLYEEQLSADLIGLDRQWRLMFARALIKLEVDEQPKTY